MRSKICDKCKKKTDSIGFYKTITFLDGLWLCENDWIAYVNFIKEKSNEYIQPERSKREDCKIKFCFRFGEKTTDEQYERMDNTIGHCCPNLEQVLEILQMRCSEHCGNTVRDK